MSVCVLPVHVSTVDNPLGLKWKKSIPSEVVGIKEPNVVGRGNGGPVLPRGMDDGDKLSPLGALLLFIPTSFWRVMVIETNRYAEQQAAGQGTGCRGWTDVTVGEMMVWHGLCMAMSMHPLPSLSLYWRKGIVGAVRYPNFGRFMTLKRFEQIKRFFHMADNTVRPTFEANPRPAQVVACYAHGHTSEVHIQKMVDCRYCVGGG